MYCISFFLLGLIVGSASVFILARRVFRNRSRHILKIIYLNRHRHPAHILERIQNYVLDAERDKNLM